MHEPDPQAKKIISSCLTQLLGIQNAKLAAEPDGGGPMQQVLQHLLPA